MQHSQDKFIVKREICTEIVFQDPITGQTHREMRRQVQLSSPAQVPVLASEHNDNCLPFLNSASWQGKAEPLRDPNILNR